MTDEEFLDQLRCHATAKGFVEVDIAHGKIGFRHGARAALSFDYPPTLSPRINYLRWAKGMLTSDYKSANGIPPSISSSQRKPKPSTYLSEDWLYASSGEEVPDDVTGNGGKWMLFFPPEEIDEHWARIKVATMEGRLTFAAKVSTAYIVLKYGHVICVYTRDAEDQAEREEARARLRTLGYGGSIGYKPNAWTRERRPGSKYRSR